MHRSEPSLALAVEGSQAAAAPNKRLPAAPTAAPASPRRISSAQLLGQDKLVEIAHADHIYQLRLTAAGKLILTK